MTMYTKNSLTKEKIWRQELRCQIMVDSSFSQNRNEKEQVDANPLALTDG